MTAQGYQHFFRVCFLDDRQGPFAADLMQEVLSNKNIAILHDNSTYAQGLAEETKKSAEELGMQVVFYDAINPKDQDFTPTLTKLKGPSAESVYFTGYHPQAGLLLKQAHAGGLKTQWLGGNASNNPELIKIAGIEEAAGAMFTTEPLPKDLEFPEAKKFIADYKAKYGAGARERVVGDGGRCLSRHRGGHDEDQVHRSEGRWRVPAQHFKNFPGITGPILGFDEKGDRIGTIHKAYVINDKGEFVPNAKQP